MTSGASALQRIEYVGYLEGSFYAEEEVAAPRRSELRRAEKVDARGPTTEAYTKISQRTTSTFVASNSLTIESTIEESVQAATFSDESEDAPSMITMTQMETTTSESETIF
ncbi:hypothetical protein FRB95_004907 [Tulasnella sp. JGI-2019a]|nr:hypothetical protein FRB95_004907 [Tulasnella sp. JGI-2019a]